MANDYLVDIHLHVSERIIESETEAARLIDRGDKAGSAFHEGKLHELRRIRKFLSENFDLTTQVYY